MQEKKQMLLSIVPALLIALFISCQSTGMPKTGLGNDIEAIAQEESEDSLKEATAKTAELPLSLPLPALDAKSLFFMRNIEKIKRNSLSNGIDIIIYKDTGRPITSLYLVYSNCASIAKENKPGLEFLTLQTIANGPRSMDDAQWSALCDSSGMRLVTRMSHDLSSLGIEAPAQTFDAALQGFLACVLDPDLKRKSFDANKADMMAGLIAAKSSSMGRVESLLRARAFFGHPYAVPPQGSADFSDAIGLEDVQAWYKEEMGVERMSIVVVGDVDAQKLTTLLEESLGALPRKAEQPSPPSRWAFDQELFIMPTAAARESFLQGYFAAPGPSDADSPAFTLAIAVLDKLLFRSVRSLRGEAYGVGAYCNPQDSPHASIWLLKTSNPAKVKKYFDEVVLDLANGLGPSASGDIGSLSPLSQTLDSWKSTVINGFFSGSGKSGDIAWGLSSALHYYDDPAEYFRFVDRINAVNADDLVKVTRRWILPARVSWVILGGSMALQTVDPDEWQSFPLLAD